MKNFYKILQVSLVIFIASVYIFRVFNKNKQIQLSKTPTHLVKEEVLFLLKRNDRIQAIKLLRRSLNMRLKESIEYIDNIDKVDVSESVSSEKLINEILALISQKKKIEAIKLVRLIKKFDLKKSKEFVDAIEKKYDKH